MPEDLPEFPFSASEQRRYRVLAKYAERRQAREQLLLTQDAPESLKAFDFFDDHDLEGIPDYAFGHAAKAIISNRDWYEFTDFAVRDLEDLDRRYTIERQTHDTFELAERHGKTQALLLAAKEAHEKAIDPEQVAIIKEDDILRETISELYLARARRIQVVEIADAIGEDAYDVRNRIGALHVQRFVLAVGDAAGITPRGEVALERALELF
jgi:hypothetical protein